MPDRFIGIPSPLLAGWTAILTNRPLHSGCRVRTSRQSYSHHIPSLEPTWNQEQAQSKHQYFNDPVLYPGDAYHSRVYHSVHVDQPSINMLDPSHLISRQFERPSPRPGAPNMAFNPPCDLSTSCDCSKLTQHLAYVPQSLDPGLGTSFVPSVSTASQNDHTIFCPDLVVTRETDSTQESQYSNFQLSNENSHAATEPWLTTHAVTASPHPLLLTTSLLEARGSSMPIESTEPQRREAITHMDSHSLPADGREDGTHYNGTDGCKGSAQFKIDLPRRRRINRKTGRACLLCGLEKVKVGRSVLQCLSA